MAIIIGTSKSETLVGTTFVDSIFGAGGNDILIGLAGADLLVGGNGRDRLAGDDGNDSLYGGSGRDKISGGKGADILFGQDFNDRLDGGSDGDRLDGGTGQDSLIGGTGNDTIEGGSGNDIAIFSGFKDDYSIKIVDGKIEVRDQNLADGDDGTDLLNGVEFLQFKDGKVPPPSAMSAIDLATLDGTNGFTLLGIDDGDQSGWSVSSAGDVNGDGFADLLVGAPGAGANKGESYVVFGKESWTGTPSLDLATLDGSNGFNLIGIDADDRSGHSVSSAGDVNGDGFADLIVAARLAGSAGGANLEGESYVVFGKASWAGTPSLDLATLDGTNGFRLIGIDALDISGNSVSSAGDVNGDGFTDLIVGAPYAESAGGADREGESYVVFGKASWAGTPSLDLAALDGTSGFSLIGIDADDQSGWSVSSGGDVNGDGFADLIVGARAAESPGGANLEGESYVVFGKASWAGTPSLDLATLDGTNGFSLIGIDTVNISGSSVSSAGDVNGDGFADLIVGAPYAENYEGESYVVFGKASWAGTPSLDLATLDGSNGFRLTGIDATDRSGFKVSLAGDVNGDGFADVIIGTRYAEDADGATSEGESYVVYGKASWAGTPSLDLAALDGTNGFRLIGIDELDLSAYSVSSAGDVNGDGFADLIVGAPIAAQPGATTVGESYVVFGRNFTGAVTHLGTSGDDTLTGTAAAETFVGGTGNDTMIGNGGADAFQGGAGDDVIVLNPGDVVRVDGGNGIDRVMANDFGTELDFTGDLRNRFQSIEVLDLSGFVRNQVTLDAASIAHMTGSNGDAFEPNTLVIRGEADFVIFADQGWTKGGEVADPLGQGDTYISWTNGAVTALVDFKSEVVQAPRIDLADLDADDGFKIAGASGVGRAGDVNADGIDDFVVNADKSYVIFGKADGLDGIDLSTLTPDQGFVVSRSGSPGDEGGLGGGASGDFNGDGIDDVIFGAPFADTAVGIDAGEAYVVFGDVGGPGDTDVTTMSGSQGFRISGGAAGDWTGIAAASAGDFNGDGVDDIIIGAREADPLGRYSAGQAYVIYGKLGGTGDIDLAALTPDKGFRIVGEGTDDDLGDAVNSVGDINGDGYDDIIVGAPFVGSGFGEAYVIFGKEGGSLDIDIATLSPAEGFRLSVQDEDFLGRAASSAGDINGDGIGDLVVSAYRGGYGGLVYVVYGKESGLGDLDLTTLDGTEGFQLFGFQSGARIGRSVDFAGDVNGDGIDDIVLGAPQLDVLDREEAGQAFVIFGREGGHGNIDLTSLDKDQGFAIAGAAAYDGTGERVSAADVNGDGFTDILVGGKDAHVIYGGDINGAVTHLGTAADDSLTGTATAETFVGGLGNDVILGGGSADAFQGAAGNDALHAGDRTFQRADGGNGDDVLHLDFDGLIDLGDIDNDAATADHTKIRNIETLDTDNGFSNQIAVSLSDILEIDASNHDVGGVASLDNVLKIDGDGGDTLSLDPTEAWSGPDTATLAGYAIYAAGNVKIAVDQDITVAVA